jgi:hypothetical protein
MTLAELIAEVYTITNRPDLVAQTLTAVRSATLKIHQSDYYYKDIFETGIQFVNSLYLQQIDYRTIVPRWRSLKYLRKTDITGYQDGPFFEVLAIPEMVEDAYRLNRNDVCYVAGEVVQVRSSTQLQYAILGCYRNPDITQAGYSSWVALDHPYAIVFEAASNVFKMIGDTDQFAAYSGLAGQQLVEVRMSNIQGIGY